MTKNLVPSLLLDIFGFSVDGLKGSPSHCLSQFSQVFGPWIVRNCGIPPFLRTNHDKSISLPSIQASVAALIRVFHGKKPILMATVNTQISWLNPNFYENKWLSSQFFSMKFTISWWKADIFMVKSRHFHGEVPISLVPPDLVFSGLPRELRRLGWLRGAELAGTAGLVPGGGKPCAADGGGFLGWKLLIFRWVFIDFFGYGSIPMKIPNF